MCLPSTVSSVVLSTNLRNSGRTLMSWCDKKSMPIIAVSTSASINDQRKFRLKPRVTVTVLVPNVRIELALTALRIKGAGNFLNADVGKGCIEHQYQSKT